MTEIRRIRDPIYGFIPITAQEAKIINTPIFQRLRGISQLAFANLVYPGANHTRFEHSLGVCHVAGKMAITLDVKKNRRLVRLAALLHDIGHGPFSHVSEEALEIYTDRELLEGHIEEKEKIHELITADIIKNDTGLTRILGKSDCEIITSLLSEGYGEPIHHSIISGPLDADKQDYLLRDSYFCGVKYGMFDIEQLHRELRTINDPSGKILTVSFDGLHALEQFILAKYYLTTQVYRHRIRLITDQMLTRSIILGIEEDGIDELRKLYTYDRSQEFLSNYSQTDDAKFVFSYTSEKYHGKYCYNILNRLKQRELLKKIYEKKIYLLAEESRIRISGISRPKNKAERRELEKTLFEPIKRILKDNNCGNLNDSDVNLIIIHSYSIKSVKEQSRDGEGPILLINESDARQPVPFEEESTLFKAIDEKFNESSVEVYAPVRYNTSTQKKALLAKIDEAITAEINSFYGKGDSNEHP